MELPNRKLHRLPSWDYSQNGYYYITVCTHNRRNLLCVGNAVPGVPNVSGNENQMVPTEIGKIVLEAWDKMSRIDSNIKTDYFCLMPNHIHGIIVIENQPFTENEEERRRRRSIHDLVRGFKSVTTREYNKIVSNNEKNLLWQSSFYDEIIKNEDMLYETRRYIDENPMKWQDDKLYMP